MSEELLLNVKNLHIAYQDNPTVMDVNFTLNKGEVLAIVGESGSGKTTVIRAILGLLSTGGKITTGDIVFEGRSLNNLAKREWQPIRGKEISMIFQDSGSALDPIQKIGKQFREYFKTHETLSDEECDAKAISLLASVALTAGVDILQRYPYELSGGQRQRLGVAMGLALSPKLLLGDEPTSALDVTTQAQVVLEMKALAKNQGTAIIIVTHNLGVAAHMADKILVMKSGRVVDSGMAKDVLENPSHEYTKHLMDSVPTLEGGRYVE